MQYGLERMRSQLYTAVVCDALDQIGLRNQCRGQSASGNRLVQSGPGGPLQDDAVG